MNNWNIMDWNVRGINSQGRWDDIRQRTEDSNCNTICLQETKKDTFDSAYIKKIVQEESHNIHMFHLLGTLEV